jgi:hypothetical protein
MSATSEIDLPAPTAWPLIMATGFTLLAAGLVTTELVGLVGGALALAGAVGWFKEVLPVERIIVLQVEPTLEPRIEPQPPTLIPHIAEGGHRARVPVEIYPISAGIKGGLAGGGAMALLAITYGLISHRSPWYPINLLVASVYAPALSATTEQLTAFYPWALGMGIIIHGLASLLVGTLYGVLLPMFPRRPILVGGFVAPLTWTALLAPTMEIINPVLARRIDWLWFIASQIGFGLAAGVVVSHSLRIHTLQSATFAERAGLEPGPRR